MMRSIAVKFNRAATAVTRLVDDETLKKMGAEKMGKAS